MANRRITTNPSNVVELVGLFSHQLNACCLRPGENCLVITDTAFNPVYSDACLGAALTIGARAAKLVLPAEGELPNRLLDSSLTSADLVVYMTTHTLHYSKELAGLLSRGGRALMAVQPLQALQRLKFDPVVRTRARAGAARLARADSIHITSAAGSDLTMFKGSRPALSNYGAADEPGRLDFWGGGMVQTAELEEATNGTLVLDTGDCIFSMGRYVEHPVRIVIENGRVVSIIGGLDAFLLRTFLESFHDQHALQTGHIAWGVDRRANWTACAVTSPEPGLSGADIESYFGNIQVEIGSNNDIAFQGSNSSLCHLGLCMLNSTLTLDGETIIQTGQLT
jgi:2,5-dihydroxypyridine 5,6-dioxygenase